MAKRVWPGLLSSRTWPPCAVVTASTMASPRPVLPAARDRDLAYLDTHTAPPSAWVDAQKALIADADKPSALVRFVFLPSLQKLAESTASQPANASTQ